MGAVVRFRPNGALLVDDRVVYGGNPFRQEDKLGPRREQMLDEGVWPA